MGAAINGINPTDLRASINGIAEHTNRLLELLGQVDWATAERSIRDARTIMEQVDWKAMQQTCREVLQTLERQKGA
jgi:hypothetical protein